MAKGPVVTAGCSWWERRENHDNYAVTEGEGEDKDEDEDEIGLIEGEVVIETVVLLAWDEKNERETC